jgi:hypothetical protein
MFGSVNALFTGLALYALVYGLIVQREEVALLRDELSVSRGIAEKQVETLDEQAAIFRKQAAEDRLVKLIDTLAINRRDFHGSLSGLKVTGVQGMSEMLNAAGRDRMGAIQNNERRNVSTRKEINDFGAYIKILMDDESQPCEQYFGNICMILMQVDELVGFDALSGDFAINLLSSSIGRTDRKFLAAAIMANKIKPIFSQKLRMYSVISIDCPPIDSVCSEWVECFRSF